MEELQFSVEQITLRIAFTLRIRARQLMGSEDIFERALSINYENAARCLLCKGAG